MVWVGTSLLTRGEVFQWASTIKTRPNRKTRFSLKTVRLSRKISLSQKQFEGVSYDIAGKLYISQKSTDFLTREFIFSLSKTS